MKKLVLLLITGSTGLAFGQVSPDTRNFDRKREHLVWGSNPLYYHFMSII